MQRTIQLRLSFYSGVDVTIDADFVFERCPEARWKLTAVESIDSAVWYDRDQGTAVDPCVPSLARWNHLIDNADDRDWVTKRNRVEFLQTIANRDSLCDALDEIDRAEREAAIESAAADNADRYLDRLKTVGSFG